MKQRVFKIHNVFQKEVFQRHKEQVEFKNLVIDTAPSGTSFSEADSNWRRPTASLRKKKLAEEQRETSGER